MHSVIFIAQLAIVIGFVFLLALLFLIAYAILKALEIPQ